MSKKAELRTLIDLIKHKAGITQAEVADRAGYKRTYLSEVLSKDNPPTKLISKLKLTFAEVLNNEHYLSSEKKESQSAGLKQATRPATGYTDEYIALLKEKANSAQGDLMVKINAILAYQQTIYEALILKVAKDHKRKPQDVRAELDEIFAGKLQEVLRLDN